ncbi:hypothetical protein FGO68_gene4281 [Halteria grandinella]|uniref:Uncharacterized protein n=1 Tax=Halteria grandinella TaxID=5974 RepID=A0A8J8P271_HALGN|nr:hypothetical protein FGO68_gene4281 [Halteria grandinella]
MLLQHHKQLVENENLIYAAHTPSVPHKSNLPVIPLPITHDINMTIKNIGQLILDNIRANFRNLSQLGEKRSVDEILSTDEQMQAVSEIEQMCFKYLEKVTIKQPVESHSAFESASQIDVYSHIVIDKLLRKAGRLPTILAEFIQSHESNLKHGHLLTRQLSQKFEPSSELAKVPALHDYHKNNMDPKSNTQSKRLLHIPSPKKAELKKTVEKQNEKLEKLTTRIAEQQLSLEKISHDYLKELNNLRIQVQSKERKQKKFEYIDVHYFEPTDTLSKDNCVILNAKLKDVKDLYERHLKRFQTTNVNLQSQIDTYLRLEADGNIGIRFNEMSAEQVIKKLSIITKDPRAIWRAFDSQFGYGFFFDVLEKEFGITPETRDKLIDRFDKEISKFKTAANTQISSMTEKTFGELDRLRREIEDKNLEISMLKQKHLIELDRVKDNISEAMEVRMQGQLAKQFRIFDDEKAELFLQIRELEAATGNFKTIKQDYDLRTFFTKWLYIAKLRTIKSQADYQQKAEMAANVEKQEQDRDLHHYLRKNPHIDIKEELQLAKAEIIEISEQMSELQYNIYATRKEKEFLADKVQEMIIDNEKLRTDYDQLKKDAQLSSNEYQTLKSNYDGSQKYIKMLEAEQSHMKQKIIRLNEIAEQFMQQPEIVESAFTAATTGTQKAINELNHNIMKKVDEIFVEKIAHKGTLTNLFGLNKQIEKKDEGKAPAKDCEVQVIWAKNNAHSQTDEGTLVDHHYFSSIRQKQESPGFRPAPKLKDAPLKRNQTIKRTYENQSPALKREASLKKSSKKDTSNLESSSSKNVLKREPSKSKSNDQSFELLAQERSRPVSKINKKSSKGQSVYPSEEHTEQSDDQSSHLFQERDSVSNLMDALSADENLKREVSNEVDEEFRREERLQEICLNSKEVQYSEQPSVILCNDQQSVIIQKTPNKSPSIINFERQARNQSPVMTVDKNKTIPLTLAYMERVMTKLGSFSNRRKRTREKCVQTKNSSQQNFEQMTHNAGKIYDSMTNFTDITTHIRKSSNFSGRLDKKSAHTRNEAFSHHFQAQTEYSNIPSHLKSFSQIQPETDPHRKQQIEIIGQGKKKKIRHISDVQQLNLSHKHYNDISLKEDIEESIISQGSSQRNNEHITTQRTVAQKAVNRIAPYFNTEITIKKMPTNSRNSNVSLNSNNRRTLISNIHPLTSGDQSIHINSSTIKEQQYQEEPSMPNILYGVETKKAIGLHRPFTARLANMNVKRLNRRAHSRDTFGSDTSFTVLQNNPDLLVVENRRINK